MSHLLVFGDLHLKRWSPQQIKAQTECILANVNSEKPSYVLFLGDVFEDRKPDPKTIECVYNFFKELSDLPFIKMIYVIRGNHDTDSKTNNVSEMGSILELLSKVVEKTIFIKSHAFYEIENQTIGCVAHFEDGSITKQHIDSVLGFSPNFLFGHFGFEGCLSRSNFDFSLKLEDFACTTILGHIHKFEEYSAGKGNSVFLLGTPYSTSWHDNDSTHYMMSINLKNGKYEFKEVAGGVRHITLNDFEVKDWLEKQKDKTFFYCIRILLDPIKEEKYKDDIKKLQSLFPQSRANIDYRFRPIVDKTDNSNTYIPSEAIDCVDEDLISDYISSSNTTLPKDKLIQVLDRIKNVANKED